MIMLRDPIFVGSGPLAAWTVTNSRKMLFEPITRAPASPAQPSTWGPAPMAQNCRKRLASPISVAPSITTCGPTTLREASRTCGPITA